MTKEEAIKVLNQVRQYTDYPKEAFTMAIDALSQPYLPSNLDEAAEEIATDIAPTPHRDIDFDKCFEKIKDGIKAGAEWLAGQFQKIEGDLVDWYSTSDGKDYCCGVKTDEAFEVPEGFYIRKK